MTVATSVGLTMLLCTAQHTCCQGLSVCRCMLRCIRLLGEGAEVLTTSRRLSHFIVFAPCCESPLGPHHVVDATHLGDNAKTIVVEAHDKGHIGLIGLPCMSFPSKVYRRGNQSPVCHLEHGDQERWSSTRPVILPPSILRLRRLAGSSIDESLHREHISIIQGFQATWSRRLKQQLIKRHFL
jgi:hypothetical protein